jgi:hypothetical protein
MDAILAIIANGGPAIILIYREAGRNELISYSLYKFKTFDGGHAQPLGKIPWVGYVPLSNPCRWRGKMIHHGGGVFVSSVFQVFR